MPAYIIKKDKITKQRFNSANNNFNVETFTRFSEIDKRNRDKINFNINFMLNFFMLRPDFKKN
jgi:hypothetical protein